VLATRAAEISSCQVIAFPGVAYRFDRKIGWLLRRGQEIGVELLVSIDVQYTDDSHVTLGKYNFSCNAPDGGAGRFGVRKAPDLLRRKGLVIPNVF
jgi:hypothetical protein